MNWTWEIYKKEIVTIKWIVIVAWTISAVFCNHYFLFNKLPLGSYLAFYGMILFAAYNVYAFLFDKYMIFLGGGRVFSGHFDKVPIDGIGIRVGVFYGYMIVFHPLTWAWVEIK